MHWSGVTKNYARAVEGVTSHLLRIAVSILVWIIIDCCTRDMVMYEIDVTLGYSDVRACFINRDIVTY